MVRVCNPCLLPLERNVSLMNEAMSTLSTVQVPQAWWPMDIPSQWHPSYRLGRLVVCVHCDSFCFSGDTHNKENP